MRTPAIARTIIGLALLFVFGGVLRAQPYWVRHVGSYGNDHVSDVKVDESGDLFITGEFSGDADFVDSTYEAGGGIDCFIARVSPGGEVIWWRQGGGFGIDRGIKLAFGPGNTLAVVGEFMGQADFQGTLINSQGSTPDMFCAVFDRSTGELQWIRNGGGALGSDRPYGVTVAPNGQVTLAGEFRGTASWGPFSLTSTPEQETFEPTMDVVVVSYAADGTPLWVQHGAADRQDRAIDVVSDAQGNFYVTGQFSDTVTFDQQHLNAMYNATFLLKLDASGTEVWFRRCGGAIYDHVRDMQFTPDGDLLLVGDLQGTMIFMDGDPDFISGEQPYNYYLLRVGTDGELIAQGQLGSQNGLSARGIALRNDTLAVVGQFNCQFTALSAFYGGEGLFMAAGAEDVFVTKHRLNDLGFTGARHYGGPGAKLAGQAAFLDDGDVVACGSFTRSISFATTTTFPIDGDYFEGYASTAQPSQPGGCAGLVGHNFRSQDATGLKDGFLARTWVEHPVVYDWWSQQTGVCDHPATWTMCVRNSPGNDCPDTLVVCGETTLQAYLPFIPSIGQANSVGPWMEVTWNTGDTAISVTVTETGLYEAHAQALNGCWSWSDAIYVVVNPMPPDPAISDNIPVNANTLTPEDIHLCDPASVLIWCPNADTTIDHYWTALTGSPPPDTTWATSIVADTTGIYTFFMVTDAGCRDSISVNVIDHATPDLDSLDLAVAITFTGDSLLTDSLGLCPGENLQFQVLLTWFWNGDTIPFPQDLILEISLNGADWITQSQPEGWTGGADQWGTGWYHILLLLRVANAPCGQDTVLWAVQDSIWVDGWPESVLGMSISGASTMCVGDSTLLTANCPDCLGLVWSGANVSGDSTTAVWALQEGNYSVYGSAVDSNGCGYSGTYTFHLTTPNGPLLLIDPEDGIICPEDSALIYTTTPGNDLVWYGPFGPVANDAQQLWTEVPGEYYLTMTDTLGCELVSDPALITAYSTPYLNVLPDEVLCLNEPEILLQVVTTMPSSIVWSPPFSGSVLQQEVTEPGVYMVTSTACGITTEMSVTVVASDVVAAIAETGPFTLCDGEGLVLHAVPGAAVYIWMPDTVFADSLVITQPGEYFLQVVNSYGCADTSDVIMVDVWAIADPIAAAGDTICAGGSATLLADGSGLMTWYSDPAGQNALFTGSPITVQGLIADATYYVMQMDGPCASAMETVTVVVGTVPDTVGIDAPAVVCSGTEAVIALVAPPGVSAAWTTPTGDFIGTGTVIADFSSAHAGIWTAVPFIGDCTGQGVSVSIGYADPASFSLGPDTTFCIGANYTLAIPAWSIDPVWSTGAEGTVITIGADGIYSVYALDTNGCVMQDTVVITGKDCEPIIPNVITPNGDGSNDVFTIIGADGYLLAIRIHNRWGDVVWESEGRDIRWNGRHLNNEVLSDGVYYYELLRTGAGEEDVYTGYLHILRGK
jgi:gliding motility-associated-like protein